MSRHGDRLRELEAAFRKRGDLGPVIGKDLTCLEWLQGSHTIGFILEPERCPEHGPAWRRVLIAAAAYVCRPGLTWREAHVVVADIAGRADRCRENAYENA
jgi:hypothetical protein